MTILVRDEADILDENIAFHLAHGVDYVLISDNLSSDATAEIAHRYVRAGYAHYEFQADDIYAQSRWVSGMARKAYLDFGADWVINSDTDEFWIPNSGSLKDILTAVPDDVFAVTAERTNFVPRPDESLPFWRRMDVRWLSSQNALGQPLQGKMAHRGSPEVIVSMGNHAISIDGVAPKSIAADIDILHFPVRTQRQYLNKIAKGGRALANNEELEPGLGRAWRYLYDLYTQGRFNEASRREFLTEGMIDYGLSCGSLVRDDRLIRALSSQLSAI